MERRRVGGRAPRSPASSQPAAARALPQASPRRPPVRTWCWKQSFECQMGRECCHRGSCQAAATQGGGFCRGLCKSGNPSVGKNVVLYFSGLALKSCARAQRHVLLGRIIDRLGSGKKHLQNGRLAKCPSCKYPSWIAFACQGCRPPSITSVMPCSTRWHCVNLS